MKKILMISLCLLFQQAYSQTKYYVSNSGSDGNNGTSVGTAWKTLEKLNGGSVSYGDSVYFNKGNTFYGSIVPVSGVYYGSYGSGAKPIISGFTTVAGWTNKGSNIWESTDTVATNHTPNIVLVNGNVTAMGRTPNTGAYYTVGAATSTTLFSSSLSAGSWVGAEAVTKDNIAIYIRRPILTQSSGNITYAAVPIYVPKSGWGFFIQNSLATLDIQNEWYYNPSTKKISVFSSGEPTSVKVPYVDSIVTLFGKNNVVFDGLQFEGANKYAFIVGYSYSITVKNCIITHIGDAGILGQGWGTPSGRLSITNNIFKNNINNGIVIGTTDFDNPYIGFNTFDSTGLIEGMSGGVGTNDGQSNAIRVENVSNAIVENNTITNTGSNGIWFTGQNTKVRNNFIQNFCLIKGDEGGVYSYSDGITDGKEIIGNIILDGGHGNSRGTLSGDDAHGIYLDDFTNGVLIKGNVIANVAYSGIFLHNNKNIKVRDNLVYNADAYGFLEVGGITGLTSKNNIFVAKDVTDMALGSGNPTGRDMDSNYYERPIDDTKTLYSDFNDNKSTLESWKSNFGVELNSHKSPVAVTDTSKIKFEYNPTSSNKVISLSKTYIDVKGNSHSGSVTLTPFSGIVLLDGTVVIDAPSVSVSGTTVSPTSVTLTGTVTPASGQTITGYYWTKMSGGSATIVSPNSINTSVTGLSGSYVFRLTVTQSDGQQAYKEINVPLLLPVEIRQYFIY